MKGPQPFLISILDTRVKIKKLTLYLGYRHRYRTYTHVLQVVLTFRYGNSFKKNMFSEEKPEPAPGKKIPGAASKQEGSETLIT